MLTVIDHAEWCDRQHPETEDGRTWLVDRDRWLTGEYPYLDATDAAGLLRMLTRVAAEEGTPLLEVPTDDGVQMRLCAMWRVRELQCRLVALTRGLRWSTGRLTLRR